MIRAGSVLNINLAKNTITTIFASIALSGCAAVQDFLAPLGSSQEEMQPEPVVEQVPLEPINRHFFTIPSPDQSVVGELQIVYTSEENTFSDLAREYGLGYDEIVAANPGIDPWLPGEQTPVLLPTQFVLPDVPRRGLVLNIASKRLFYFPPVAAGAPVQVLTYPIGIGRVGWQTPLGNAAVIAKARDPSWYVPASVRREHAELGNPLPAVVPPGPDNPLGHFVLKLDMPGYLIHGTNRPYGVGMRVSHGCVRLYPENIESLYEMVEVGEPVMIIDEPYLAGYRDGELYFESHSPLEDDQITPEERLQKLFERTADRSGEFMPVRRSEFQCGCKWRMPARYLRVREWCATQWNPIRTCRRLMKCVHFWMNLSNPLSPNTLWSRTHSMNEWLDLMLGEIDRKKREAAEAEVEIARRSGAQEPTERQADKKSTSS